MSRSGELYNIDGRFFQAKTERQIAGRPSEVATASRWPQQPLRERTWTEAPAPALISKLDTHDTKSMTGDVVADTERIYGGVVLDL